MIWFGQFERVTKNRRKFAATLTAGTLALAITVAFPYQHADATTINFVALANDTIAGGGGGEGAWGTQTAIIGGNYTVGGITVTASATGNQYSVPYLDDAFAYNPARNAGLGVCSTNGGCGGLPDDNIGRAGDNAANPAEHLLLTFISSPVVINDLYFRDRDHFTFTGSLLINGSSYDVTLSSPLGCGDNDNCYGRLHFATPLYGSVFDFSIGGTNIQDRDFYVSKMNVTAVPGPIVGAGLPGLLFTSGGIFAWWRRRRNAVATSIAG